MSNSWKMQQEDIQCDPACRYYCRGLTDPCTYIGWGGVKPCKLPPNTIYSQETFSRICDTLKDKNIQKTEVNDNGIYRK